MIQSDGPQQSSLEQVKGVLKKSYSFFRFCLRATFPAYPLINTIGNLRLAGYVSEDPWFNLVIARNVAIFFVLSLPLFGVCGWIAYSIAGNEVAYKLFELSYKGALSGKIAFTIKVLKSLFKLSPWGDSSLLFKIILFCNFAVYCLVRYGNPMIVGTNRLRALLRKNATFGTDELARYDSRTVLYTPKGILLDITGKTAKDVLNDEHLWIPMNIRVSEHMEHPTNRAIVFIKKGFALKAKYIYDK